MQMPPNLSNLDQYTWLKKYGYPNTICTMIMHNNPHVLNDLLNDQKEITVKGRARKITFQKKEIPTSSIPTLHSPHSTNSYFLHEYFSEEFDLYIFSLAGNNKLKSNVEEAIYSLKYKYGHLLR